MVAQTSVLLVRMMADQQYKVFRNFKENVEKPKKCQDKTPEDVMEAKDNER